MSLRFLTGIQRVTHCGHYNDPQVCLGDFCKYTPMADDTSLLEFVKLIVRNLEKIIDSNRFFQTVSTP